MIQKASTSFGRVMEHDKCIGANGRFRFSRVPAVLPPSCAFTHGRNRNYKRQETPNFQMNEVSGTSTMQVKDHNATTIDGFLGSGKPFKRFQEIPEIFNKSFDAAPLTIAPPLY